MDQQSTCEFYDVSKNFPQYQDLRSEQLYPYPYTDNNMFRSLTETRCDEPSE